MIILAVVKFPLQDTKEVYKKQICELSGELKKNERNKSEFITGFKKQLQLIDNLKKQRVRRKFYFC